MNEKTLIESLVKNELPDLEKVRQNCLNRKDVKERSKRGKLVVSCAMVMVVALCLCVTPVRNVAVEAIQQIMPGLQTIDKGNVEKEANVEEAGTRRTDCLEGKSDVSDLVYREVEGNSISLKEGQRIDISNAGTKDYKKVSIARVGGSAEELGDLKVDGTLSFQAEETGEYIIYAGKEEAENITKQVMIGYVHEVEKSVR